jgi:hypothetical protein
MIQTELGSARLRFSVLKPDVTAREEIERATIIEMQQANLGWLLRVQLPQEKAEKVIARARQRVSESSCGPCPLLLHGLTSPMQQYLWL